jgi:2-polyprenyl-3-methyl-5-hydroxy-6-metoxy-1,4-benzoquinol methylase
MYKCNICGNSISTSKNNILVINGVPQSTFFFSENTVDLHIVDCSNCGAVQLIDVPLNTEYDAVYRSIGVSVNYREEKTKQIEKFIKIYKLHESNLIEVGCGNGQFLEIFKEIGLQRFSGIESGNDNYNECIAKGFKIVHGNLFDAITNIDLRERFDVFASFHHLEHQPDPVKFVTALYQLLKPGGIGLVEVPNYDFTEKNCIWLEFTRDHRFYYRNRTICYLFSKCGFDIESVEENNGGICLTIIVKKPVFSDRVFTGMRMRIKQDVEEFKRLIDSLDGSFAVYGAGHYSQLILNMVNRQYGIKPKHIYDSNRKKCGSNICGTVIEQGENAFKMNDCENIIIICAAYNNEVHNMLSGSGKNLIKWE